MDPSTGAAIAPLDLSVGHVLEFSVGSCVREAPPVYAAVVRVASDEVVVIEFEDVDTAVQAAVHVAELWQRRWASAGVTSNVRACQ